MRSFHVVLLWGVVLVYTSRASAETAAPSPRVLSVLSRLPVQGAVEDVAFSSDAVSLATVSEEDGVRLWDVDSGIHVCDFEPLPPKPHGERFTRSRRPRSQVRFGRPGEVVARIGPDVVVYSVTSARPIVSVEIGRHSMHFRDEEPGTRGGPAELGPIDMASTFREQASPAGRFSVLITEEVALVYFQRLPYYLAGIHDCDIAAVASDGATVACAGRTRPAILTLFHEGREPMWARALNTSLEEEVPGCMGGHEWAENYSFVSALNFSYDGSFLVVALMRACGGNKTELVEIDMRTRDVVPLGVIDGQVIAVVRRGNKIALGTRELGAYILQVEESARRPPD